MKKLICYYLAAAQIFAGVPVFADQIDDAIREARKMRDALDKTFVPFLRSAVQASIKTQYLYDQFDYLTIRRELAYRAATGIQKLNQIRGESEILYSSLFAPNAAWDETASRFMALAAEAHSHQINATLLNSDGITLRDNWKRACDQDRRINNERYMNPLIIQKLFTLDPAPSGPKPNFEVYIQLGVDSGGNMAPQATDQNKDQKGEYEEAYVGTAVALLSIYPVGTIVGGVMLLAYGLYKLITFGLASAHEAEQKQRLQDAKNEILAIQLGGLETVGAETKGYVKLYCDEAFPATAADLIYPQIFTDYVNLANQVLVEIREKREKILAQYKQRYEDLNQNYFPAVQAGFMGLIETRMADQAKTAAQVKTAVNEILRPLVDDFSKKRNSKGTAEWNSRQKLWSAIIQSDAVFRTRSGFSFVDTQTAIPQGTSFDNLWNDLGPKLADEMRGGTK